MTNEELIQDMKDHITRGEYEGYALTNEECIQVIQALEQQRWIPVSEGLPKEDGLYLISTCMECIDTCLFYIDEDGYTWVDYEDSVIAWKPLPEPFKVESEE